MKRPINGLILLLFILFALPVSQAEAPPIGNPISQSKEPLPPITLVVDATEAPRRIFHAKMVIPAKPGPLVLLYPKWIPGEHAPSGPIADLAGLKLTAAGKPVSWHRDPVDMYAFYCEVPEGASAVEVELDYLAPPQGGNFTSSPCTTEKLAVITWHLMLLYPQGWKPDELTYAASLRLPPGWKQGSALAVAKESGGTVEFKPVSLTTLVDSPVIAGAYFKRIALTPGQNPPHYLDIVSDSAAALAISPEMIEYHKRLVAEAHALFRSYHYRTYHFLVALSDHLGFFGLEHHECSDNRMSERTLIDEEAYALSASLLPHEFVHSWNGKYRRPKGLTPSTYQEPMRGDLIWVYEGLTEYLGCLLTARCGLWTAEEYRENLAYYAGWLDHQGGRTWRPLLDTAVAAQVLYNAREDWFSWRRGLDFYEEGVLIWLEADTIIRQQSRGQRSLADFCRRFYGGESGAPAVKPYEFDDLITTLNEVAPYDWRAFFNQRLNATGSRAPMGGIEGSGWRLVYTEEPNKFVDSSGYIDLTYSIGLVLDTEGRVVDVIPGMTAAKAGIAPGMKLVAVNTRKWSPEILLEAVKATKRNSEPLELLMENTDYYKTYRLDYHGGLRYPHLERDPSKPDLLTQILKPLTKGKGVGE